MLPDFDNFQKLRRIRVEVHHVAGLLGGLRAGVHRHADVGLRQRGRVIRAVADHRHEAAALLFVADEFELVLRFCLGEKIIHARLLGNGSGGQLVVTGNHHRADAHRAKAFETVGEAAFHDVLQMNHAERAVAGGDD